MNNIASLGYIDLTKSSKKSVLAQLTKNPTFKLRKDYQTRSFAGETESKKQSVKLSLKTKIGISNFFKRNSQTNLSNTNQGEKQSIHVKHESPELGDSKFISPDISQKALKFKNKNNMSLKLIDSNKKRQDRSAIFKTEKSEDKVSNARKLAYSQQKSIHKEDQIKPVDAQKVKLNVDLSQTIKKSITENFRLRQNLTLKLNLSKNDKKEIEKGHPKTVVPVIYKYDTRMLIAQQGNSNKKI
jgi:hypothetical protein